MRVRVLADADAVSWAAAAHIAHRARSAVAERGRFSLAVSGGSTPAAMLAALATEDVPWAAVDVFQVDERVAPDGHPERNATDLAEALLGRVPLPPGGVHLMPVTDADLAQAAAAYAAELSSVCGTPPVLDLVHLGLGDDGHTASLPPGDPVLEVTGAAVAVSAPYGGRVRMTLTLPTLNAAREVVWLVSGAGKAAVLRRVVEGDRSLPAARVLADRALLFADRPAAASLSGGRAG